MLGKLMKHEWKTSWKVPTLLIAILFILSFAAAVPFTLPVWESKWVGLPISAMLLILLFYMAAIVSSVGIVLYFAVRYYKSMFTDEGYLTHTLPVSARQLLISKTLTMSIWNMLSTIAILLSIVIFFGMLLAFVVSPEERNFSIFIQELQELMQSPQVEGWQAFVVCIVLLFPVGSISSAIMVIASITLGQMVRKHRILGSIGAYFAITMIVQTISVIGMIPVYFRMFSDEAAMAEMSVFSVYVPLYAGILVVSAVTSVGLYFLSEYLVRKKLELE